MKKIIFGVILFLMMSSLFAGQGKIRVSSDQEGAYIYVNGKKKAIMTGEGFTSILLEEGEYMVKVTKEKNKYYDYIASKKIFVGEDTSTKLKFKLKKGLKLEVKAKWEAELEEYKKTISKRDVQKRKRWVRKGDVVVDRKLGLVWQDDKTNQKTWKDAKKYCNNLEFAGYRNWRLPSYNELITIVDYDKYDPAIVPVFENISKGSYSTDNRVKNGSNFIYGINFKTGRVEYSGDCNQCFQQVRCVANIQ